MSKHQSYDRPPPYNEFYQPSAPPVPSSPTQPFRVFGPTNLVAVAPAVGGAEEDGQERFVYVFACVCVCVRACVRACVVGCGYVMDGCGRLCMDMWV